MDVSWATRQAAPRVTDAAPDGSSVRHVSARFSERRGDCRRSKEEVCSVDDCVGPSVFAICLKEHDLGQARSPHPGQHPSRLISALSARVE